MFSLPHPRVPPLSPTLHVLCNYFAGSESGRSEIFCCDVPLQQFFRSPNSIPPLLNSEQRTCGGGIAEDDAGEALGAPPVEGRDGGRVARRHAGTSRWPLLYMKLILLKNGEGGVIGISISLPSPWNLEILKQNFLGRNSKQLSLSGTNEHRPDSRD